MGNVETVIAPFSGFVAGLLFWLVIARLARILRWNPLPAATAGMAALVGGIWVLKWFLEQKNTSVQIADGSEVFTTWLIAGYALFPVGLISGSVRKLTDKSNDCSPASFRQYCATLTLALATGLIVFGGIGIPASLMRYGRSGMLTLLFLLAGGACGIAASHLTRQRTAQAFAGNVPESLRLPFMGTWTYVLLFATAATTYGFY